VLHVTDFVNADVIAKGLSEFDPEGVALSAGKIMLTRLRELAAMKARFAFETTLASRTFAPWIRNLMLINGYTFHLVYLWVPAPDLSVARVSERVKMGGHYVPDETVRRRYFGGCEISFHCISHLPRLGACTIIQMRWS